MKKKEKFRTVRGYEIEKRKKRLPSHSMEDYIEMIYRNLRANNTVKASVLAKQLNVSISSTTKMMQKLASYGLVDYEKYRNITLTEEGKKIGFFLLNRHNIVLEFLINLGIEDKVLTSTEMIEHGIDLNILNHLDLFNSFFNENPNIKKEFNKFKKKHQ